MKQAKEIMLAAEVAEYVGATRNTIKQWIRTKGFPQIHISNNVNRYVRRDVDTWLASYNINHDASAPLPEPVAGSSTLPTTPAPEPPAPTQEDSANPSAYSWEERRD